MCLVGIRVKNCHVGHECSNRTVLLDGHVIVNVNLSGGFVDISNVEVDKILIRRITTSNIPIVAQKGTTSQFRHYPTQSHLQAQRIHKVI